MGHFVSESLANARVLRGLNPKLRHSRAGGNLVACVVKSLRSRLRGNDDLVVFFKVVKIKVVKIKVVKIKVVKIKVVKKPNKNCSAFFALQTLIFLNAAMQH